MTLSFSEYHLSLLTVEQPGNHILNQDEFIKAAVGRQNWDSFVDWCIENWARFTWDRTGWDEKARRGFVEHCIWTVILNRQLCKSGEWFGGFNYYFLTGVISFTNAAQAPNWFVIYVTIER